MGPLLTNGVLANQMGSLITNGYLPAVNGDFDRDFDNQWGLNQPNGAMTTNGYSPV